MLASPFGVYVHFPYCRRRCPYCDFAVAARRTIPHARYQRQVQAEIADRAGLFAGRRAVSVYFGGGTPSLWAPESVAAVREAALRAFPPPAGVSPEVTLEADPTDLSREGLAALRAAGVTRLSLGVQSLRDERLRALGRLHSAAQALAAVGAARAAGFDNLSVDLMIGLPGQTREELAGELRGLLALAPEHLSLYQLTVEPRTAYAAAARTGALVLPPDEEQAALYQQVRETLDAAGYQHYEISSFARRDRPLRSVHNQLYWSGGEYLGVGASAHSFRYLPAGGGERFANRRGVDEYLGRRGLLALGRRADPLDAAAAGEALAVPPVGAGLHEALDAAALAREALWLGLRRIAGLSRSAFAARHGYDPVAQHRAELSPLCARGLVEVEDDVLRLSPRGVLFADEVGAALV